MSRLGPGDVLDVDFDGDRGLEDEVYEMRHPHCFSCGERCCYCPCACPDGEAAEVEDGVHVHTSCRERYQAEYAVGAAVARIVLGDTDDPN